MEKQVADLEARIIQREMAVEWPKLPATSSVGHQEAKTAEPAEK
jgi:hypothetical protein